MSGIDVNEIYQHLSTLLLFTIDILHLLEEKGGF